MCRNGKANDNASGVGRQLEMAYRSAPIDKKSNIDPKELLTLPLGMKSFLQKDI